MGIDATRKWESEGFRVHGRRNRNGRGHHAFRLIVAQGYSEIESMALVPRPLRFRPAMDGGILRSPTCVSRQFPSSTVILNGEACPRIGWTITNSIPLRINCTQSFPYDFAEVLHVYIVVHDHDDLGKHRLSQRPNRVHDFSRVAGITTCESNNHQVMEDPSPAWPIHISGYCIFMREGHALHGMPHIDLPRRRANDGRQIDRIAAL